MDGRCRAAVRNMASGLACSVMGQIGTAAWPQATAPPIEHVVLVDARLWQESHEEIERHLRCGAETVYIARPCEVAIRVENNRFSDYARLGASISGARSQRGASRVCCEAARAAIRFGGQTMQGVLKCTIAPGICPKWGVELALISLSFLSPFPPFAAQVRVPGPAHWPTGT